MQRTSPWDEIDATLLGIAHTEPTLADLIERSGLTADVVKGLVHAYVQAGYLTQAPFSLSYRLTLAGRTRSRQLAAQPLAKAA
jgi:DNA-binding IclR family transcriptional regulator